MNPRLLVAVAGLLLAPAAVFMCLPASLQFLRPRSSASRLELGAARQDLGTVRQGALIRATFPVRNAGGRRLIIWGQADDCCGQSENPYVLVLGPGERSEIVVEIDTSRWHGQLRHAARYTANDPQVPCFDLTIRATVESTRAAADVAPPVAGAREITLRK